MGKKKTAEQFKQEVFNLVGDEYTVLGEYEDAQTKILMCHNKCGHEWMVQPGNFKNGTRCPKCYGTKKSTTEEFKQEVFNLAGDEYSVLGEYVNTNTPIKMQHNTCGNVWKIRPVSFKSGTRCPKCAGNMKITTEQFRQEVFDLAGDEYSVLGEYKNNVTPVLMRHNACGHEWYVQPKNFKHGTRCPICNKGGRKKKPQTAI